LDSTTSLLESPHKRQVKEWYKALPPALQAKAQRVIEKRLANIKKVQIIKEEWDGATSGKPYEKAEEEYTMIVGAWLLSQNLEME
jgi:hypothetical protein